MEWWREQEPHPTRDYFRVEDSNGRRFWLYRDGLYGNETAQPPWFLHGLFA
jgi:protein ImuB